MNDVAHTGNYTRKNNMIPNIYLKSKVKKEKSMRCNPRAIRVRAGWVIACTRDERKIEERGNPSDNRRKPCI